MVTMQARQPMATMAKGGAASVRGAIRTHRPRPAAGPACLTRRGRIVVAGVFALIIGLSSVALATAAQATRGTGAAGARSAHVAQVVVRPGQSLWTVAETYDPDADTRLVIADIEQMNSMTGDQLQPGETLWVPRG